MAASVLLVLRVWLLDFFTLKSPLLGKVITEPLDVVGMIEIWDTKENNLSQNLV